MGTPEAWFGGLVDGEGCFTISIYVQHKRSLKFALVFSISMKTGTWQTFAQEILGFHEIPFHTRKRKNQFEITVTGRKSVTKLIGVLKPYLVVKVPIAEALADFPAAPRRNRFSPIDDSYLDAVCEKVDFVRRFNKGKNRPHKWDGKMIRAFYKK